MGALIFIACFALRTVYWDTVLRIVRFFRPDRAFAFINAYSKKMSRQGFALLSTYTGLKLKVDSRAHFRLPPVFIIASNHQSLYDIPALIRAFPDRDLKFIAKKELSKCVPFVSIGLKMGKHAVISRSGNIRDTRRELSRLAGLAKKGCCPHVFPEGTRSRTGAVGKFHTAGLRALINETGLPVLAVAIDGGYHMSGLLDMTQAGREKQYRVKALSLRPPPASNTEFLQLVKEIREEIADQLSEWRESERLSENGSLS